MRRVYLTPQLEQDRQCILALISVEAQGREELLWIAYGLRESAQSGREFLLRLRDENCPALELRILHPRRRPEFLADPPRWQAQNMPAAPLGAQGCQRAA